MADWNELAAARTEIERLTRENAELRVYVNSLGSGKSSELFVRLTKDRDGLKFALDKLESAIADQLTEQSEAIERLTKQLAALTTGQAESDRAEGQRAREWRDKRDAILAGDVAPPLDKPEPGNQP